MSLASRLRPLPSQAKVSASTHPTGIMQQRAWEHHDTVHPHAGSNSEDVKGPHAALAVRLQQRDPGRSFVLGERLQYVLLPGFRTQVHRAQGCARKSDVLIEQAALTDVEDSRSCRVVGGGQ